MHVAKSNITQIATSAFSIGIHNALSILWKFNVHLVNTVVLSGTQCD
jgi:hypothetical protein